MLLADVFYGRVTIYPRYTARRCPSPRALKASCILVMSHVTLSRSLAILALFFRSFGHLWGTEADPGSSKCSEAWPEDYFTVSFFIPVHFLALYSSWVRQCLCYGCGRGGFGGLTID